MSNEDKKKWYNSNKFYIAVAIILFIAYFDGGKDTPVNDGKKSTETSIKSDKKQVNEPKAIPDRKTNQLAKQDNKTKNVQTKKVEVNKTLSLKNATRRSYSFWGINECNRKTCRSCR